MNDISNHFCLIEPDLIKDQILFDTEIRKPDSSPRFQCNSKILFDQKPKKSDSGTSWNQTFRGVTADQEVMDWNNRRAHIGIYRTDGSLLILGSSTETPLVMVTPNVGVFIVEATFETVNPSIF